MMGHSDEFEKIEPGKRTGLLILGENPLVDICNTRALETIIRAGEVLDRPSLLSK